MSASINAPHPSTRRSPRPWQDAAHAQLSAQRRTSSATICRWIRTHQLPLPEATPDAVIGAARDSATSDAVYLALVDEHRRGDQLASNLLLLGMGPMLGHLARRCRKRYDDTLDDAEAACIEGLLLAAQRLPADRTERIATYLTMATLNHVAGRQAPSYPTPTQSLTCQGAHPQDEPCGHCAAQSTEELLVDADGTRNCAHPLGATGEVLEVIAWGLDRGALSPADAALLARIYAPDPSNPEWASMGGAFQNAVAAQLGITPTTLRYRASQAVRRLRGAVQAAGAVDVRELAHR